MHLDVSISYGKNLSRPRLEAAQNDEKKNFTSSGLQSNKYGIRLRIFLPRNTLLLPRSNALLYILLASTMQEAVNNA